MKTARKVLLLVLCAALLVSASVMGTMAYLTSKDTVTNTFTVGKVDIILDESDESTADTTDRTTEGNAYHLMPGLTYVKDPTVTVREDSEPSYIRMLVTISKYDELTEIFGDPFLPQNYVAGWDPTVWITTNKITIDEGTNTAVYEFRYNGIYTPTSDNDDEKTEYLEVNKLDALFDSITLPGDDVDNDALASLEGLTITVEAQAIQAAGFEAKGDKTAADVAWESFPVEAQG